MTNIRLRRTGMISVVALALLAVLGGGKLRLDKVEARTLVADAGRLTQNQSSLAELDKFLAKHRRFVPSNRDCDEENCVYSADLRNDSLSLLHLAPPAELFVSVTRGRDQVQEVYVSVKTAISGKLYAATIRSVGSAACRTNCKSFSSSSVRDPSGRILTSSIELGPAATAADRKIAFQLNVDCIFELKSCTDPAEITGAWPAVKD